MRMKRRHEKGEVFRKSLCCVPCSDSGDSDGVDSDTDNQKKTRKPEKSEGKNVKESGKERRKKESHNKSSVGTSAHHTKRHSTSRASPRSSEHKHSRSKHGCDCKTVDSNSRKQQQNDSNIAIISKNRITRSLGIYNKAKRSHTILRENQKQKLCKKKFEDIKSKTAKDMARVLDCTSFKIQLSSCSGSLQEGQDSPVQHISGDRDFLIQSPAGSSKTQSSCSSTGRYSIPDKSKVTPIRRITPQQITPQSESMLAFKTPLQEISESLTESLRPLQTFHGRNYFAEVQGQLRKMYKQSSVNSQVQRKADSVGVASEVQKRSLKRKSTEENTSTRRGYMGNERIAQSGENRPSNDCSLQSKRHTNKATLPSQSSETITQQSKVTQAVPVKGSSLHSSRETGQSRNYQDLCHSCVKREAKYKEDKKHNVSYGREVQRCLFGQSDAQFSQANAEAFASAHNSSSFDILDFLDGVEQASNLEDTQPHKGYLTPDPQLVSPPKKPTLELPTPEKIFYPHKLY